MFTWNLHESHDFSFLVKILTQQTVEFNMQLNSLMFF